MPYTASIQIVSAHLDRVRVSKPVQVWVPCQDPDQRVNLDGVAVDIPLLPYTCASGVEGYAGWALVGTALRGFVREGELAEMVKHDLSARLDLLLVGLERRGRAGLDYVREAERSDREQGVARRERIARKMLQALAR